MDDARRYITTNQQLDIEQILVEAQHRWLRPNEVCEILRNYKMFQLTPDPPHKPSGGSLFLFDRKILRYFRKDGHTWRKKKDGKTVREAHEKLKAGSIDVLHCYYAHGEDDDNFQRRCYWMLDTQLEHIVLVHYRVVKEGSRSTTFRTLTPDAATQTGSSQSCSAPLSAQGDSNAPTIQASYASSPSTANFNGHTSYSELLEDLESKEDLGTSSLAEANIFSGRPSVTLHTHDKAGNQGGPGLGDTSFIHLSDRPVLSDVRFSTGPPNNTELVTRKLTDVKVEPFNLPEGGLDIGAMGLPDGHAEALLRRCHRVFQETLANGNSDQADYLGSKNHVQNGPSSSHDFSNGNHFQSVHSQVQYNSGSCHLVSSNGHSPGFGNACVKSEFHNDESRELKKLDSFGRWMSEEIGRDCDDSLMASDSGNYWNTVDTENDDKEVSSLSQHMQLDNDSLAPSLSQEQLFSICDFSPDWAYSGIETKVLISGSFLGMRKHLETTEWCCMFGEVEVPAEVLTDNVLRCQAPLHAAGRVPFYITCSNRLACSEVRDFEYRENPSRCSSLAVISEPEDEIRLQVRLAKLLCLGLKQKSVYCSVENCEKCNIKNELTSMWNEEKKEWERIEKTLEKDHQNPKDSLITMLLKNKFSDWLVCSVHEVGKGPHILDDEGQGVIHLAAALGFDWAMGPIVSAGVSPSFRDAHGRTGLHWAAYYGREETVVALVKLGAAPGAVDDPTSSFPGGRTAADLASSRGHKGIGGYLAEADLTSHLSSLTLTNGSVMESVAATIAAERIVETVSVEGVQGQSSLKSSLDAVKKSAEAAALIQASFRARSFQYRRQSKIQCNEEVPMDVVALASSSISKGRKMSHFSDYLHTAAIKIQQKYRGWKGRKEFLNVRNRIVKIQAHVRGHQVRKQYKKVVWSVSILEKVILRWRRKRVGLRGFRAEGGDSQPEARKIDEYDFLRLGRKQKVAGVEKALARVQSMIRYPEAREQYMRLATNFQNSKMGCTEDIDKDTTMAP